MYIYILQCLNFFLYILMYIHVSLYTYVYMYKCVEIQQHKYILYIQTSTVHMCT